MLGRFIITGFLFLLSGRAVAQELDHAGTSTPSPSSPAYKQGITFGAPNPCSPQRVLPAKQSRLRFDFPNSGYVVEYDPERKAILVSKDGNRIAAYECNTADTQKCLEDQKVYWDKLFGSFHPLP